MDHFVDIKGRELHYLLIHTCDGVLLNCRLNAVFIQCKQLLDIQCRGTYKLRFVIIIDFDKWLFVLLV